METTIKIKFKALFMLTENEETEWRYIGVNEFQGNRGDKQLTDWLLFTGRYDINNIEIFDGDVIEFPERDKVDGKPMRFYVGWNSDNQGSRWSFYNLYKVPPGFSFAHVNSGIIIGNIHQNPELLNTK